MALSAMIDGPGIGRCVYHAGRLLLVATAVTILYAGSTKLVDPGAFAYLLDQHGIVPGRLSTIAAWAVTAGEFIVGFVVIRDAAALGRVVRPSLTLGSVFFIFALYAMLLTLHPPDRPAGCGCGWSAAPVEDWSTLWMRNTAFSFAFGLCGLWGRAIEQTRSKPLALAGTGG